MTIKRIIPIIVSIVLLPIIAFSAPTHVEISGNQVLVNGEVFEVRGACYQPILPGNDNKYEWWKHPEQYEHDLNLLKDMDATVIRAGYDRLEKNSYSESFLDACYERGIYVFLTKWIHDNSDFTPGNKDDFLGMVNYWKDHPAIFGWILGNEVNARISSADYDAWYVFLDSCAAAAKAADPNHIVMTTNSEKSGYGNNFSICEDTRVPHLDVWGIQTYRGDSFGTGAQSVFSQYQAIGTTKPFIMSEWGCDALDARTKEENQEMQAEYVAALWKEIDENISADDSSKQCLGGLVFSWTDGWWKNKEWVGVSGPQDNSVQETTGQWQNAAYYDYVAGEKNMNEEWWGICSNSFSGIRTPRDAYYALKSCWTGTTTQEPTITGLTNYPNPFRPGCGETTISFIMSPNTSATVKIYDIAGNPVYAFEQLESVSTYEKVAKLTWGGIDSQNQVVPSGLYICQVRIEGEGSSGTQYRKILALR